VDEQAELGIAEPLDALFKLLRGFGELGDGGLLNLSCSRGYWFRDLDLGWRRATVTGVFCL